MTVEIQFLDERLILSQNISRTSVVLSVAPCLQFLLLLYIHTAILTSKATTTSACLKRSAQAQP
jgi:hypothetical protein